VNGGIVMNLRSRLLSSVCIATALFSTSILAPASTHARSSSLRLVGAGPQYSVLFPGARLTVVLSVAHRQARLCLGMASLGDAFGIPATLGEFRVKSDGVYEVSARVPMNIFPAEPPGQFLLYAGRCTTVAPEGNLASLAVSIRPAGPVERAVG
jgi:hypothetical protein